MVLALLAAAGASAFWFRARTGYFPWAAIGHGTTVDAPIALTSMRSTNAEPAMAPVASPPSATRPAVPAPPTPPPPPADEKPLVARPQVPTTLPAINRAAKSDPAKAGSDLKAGLEAVNRGDLVAARQLLSRAYEAGLAPSEDQLARDRLADIAGQTLFSKRPFKNDPLAEFIVVQTGDTLGKIAARYNVSEDCLAAINDIKNKNVVRLGQRLKVVRGPWHAVVSKSRHVLDLHLQDKYVRSFRVALGVQGSTPAGIWKVANHQEDPGWTDPRTGQRWHPSDPSNPIGEYWIGLEGVDGDAVGQFGYGIHGTTEPETIGKDVSMGCIRMAPDDIALLYKLMVPAQSYVLITD